MAAPRRARRCGVTVELGIDGARAALAARAFSPRRRRRARLHRLPLRRDFAARRAAPPEPCALPAVAYTLERAAHASGGALRDRRVASTTLEPDDYAGAIETRARRDLRGRRLPGEPRPALARAASTAIRVGARALRSRTLRPLEPAAARRRRLGDRLRVAGAAARSGAAAHLRTSPIKGTRPLGVPVESAKDAAEHVMIVDLERNDLSRVAVPGSVRWPELLAERELAGVTHLVATVEAELREDVSLTELLDGGAAGRLGHRLPEARRARSDCRARAGRSRRGDGRARPDLRPNGDLDLALTIRTFAIVDGEIHLWVGGGIVWDSVAADEIEESWVKARPLLDGDRMTLLALAQLGRGVVPAGRAGAARRRRRRAARTRRVRDAARLRRPPVRAAPALRPAAASAQRLRLPEPPQTELQSLAHDALAAANEPNCVLRFLWTPRDRPRPRARRCRPISRSCASAACAPGRATGRPALLAGAKSASYAENMAAQAAAVEAGFDDALFVAPDGAVLEGPTSNVWFREGDVLHTPSLGLPILAGVTRGVIWQLAGRQGSRRAATRSSGCSRPTRSSSPPPCAR